MKMKLLVVGSGFIGNHIINEAVKRGYSVSVINDQPAAKDGIPSVVKTNVINITDSNAVKDYLSEKSFHYVINCSGYIDHTKFKDGGKNLIEQHFQGVVNLVENLDRNNLKQFVQIGSSDEYGNSKAPQDEDKREASISPYSFGKVAATHFLQMLHRTENYPAVILRLFLVYGPGQNDKRFLPQIISGCLKNLSFPTSEGKQLRDFCYITDVVNAIFLALDNPSIEGEVINIASGKPVSIKSVVEKICDISKSGKPEYGKIPYRIGENMELYASIDKAMKLLGWSPEVEIEYGLMKTVEYYKKQI